MAGIALDVEARHLLEDAKACMDAQMARLRELVPCLIDMSTRQATRSSAYGQTLQHKVELFDLGREIGPMRRTNPHVERPFAMTKLPEITEKIWRIHDRHGIPPITPMPR